MMGSCQINSRLGVTANAEVRDPSFYWSFMHFSLWHKVVYPLSLRIRGDSRSDELRNHKSLSQGFKRMEFLWEDTVLLKLELFENSENALVPPWEARTWIHSNSKGQEMACSREGKSVGGYLVERRSRLNRAQETALRGVAVGMTVLKEEMWRGDSWLHVQRSHNSVLAPKLQISKGI